ncbi:MAG TPA: aminomethyltransferase family protein [Buttiauxella sp.]|jgi:glycine cleavage system aminomethyltransferase T
MKSLFDLHTANNASFGVYNHRTLPAAYHEPAVEYKAVRENALLVDYSHMAIVSVMGDDAWALVNHLASADVSIIRDEQGLYSLVLNEDGTIRGDMYALCTADGYYILSENLSSAELIHSLNAILEKADQLDIQDIPEIKAMETEDWGVIMLEGPYSWEVMAELYGFDVIGLPYYEYMNTDDELIIFRCGKHGEFGYKMIGPQAMLVDAWQKLLDAGEKYQLKTGGLNYQKSVRVENPGWDESICAAYSRSPVELQMQWAIQYDKEDFIGKAAVEQLSQAQAERKLVGIMPQAECDGIAADDTVLVQGKEVGAVVNAVFSPALQSFIALALIEGEYALADIEGFDIRTAAGDIAAKTSSVPFLYNLSMLVNPTEHSYVDASRAKNALSPQD